MWMKADVYSLVLNMDSGDTIECVKENGKAVLERPRHRLECKAIKDYDRRTHRSNGYLETACEVLRSTR